MERFLSERAKAIEPSSLVSLLDKGRRLRAEGRDVLSFAGGEPDFNTPPDIQAAVIRCIQEGDTHYAPSPGIAPLRQRIAQKLMTENNIDLDWASQILVTPGAKYSLATVLNPGDEAMIFEPAWVS